jgi:predicted DNA-binding protein (MmcQ/YjbR family)
MNIEEIREYCLAKAGVTEGFPFDEETLVFKVGGKMFLLTGLDRPDRINIKCDPERAVERRERYPDAVFPGYHMNKKHWNTVLIDGEVSDDELRWWIDESYDLVKASLPKKVREKL